MTLTRQDIVATVGPVDDLVVADIMKVDATPADLAQAQAWLVNEEALLNDGRPLPTGPVGDLIEILRAHEPADEDDVPAAR